MATKKLMQCFLLRSIATSNRNIYVKVSFYPLFQCIRCLCGIILKVLLISTNKIVDIISGVFVLITINMNQVVSFNLNINLRSINRSMNPPCAMLFFTDFTNSTHVVVFVVVIEPPLHSISLQGPLEDICI
jgi:hypothetical protein